MRTLLNLQETMYGTSTYIHVCGSVYSGCVLNTLRNVDITCHIYDSSQQLHQLPEVHVQVWHTNKTQQ